MPENLPCLISTGNDGCGFFFADRGTHLLISLKCIMVSWNKGENYLIKGRIEMNRVDGY